MTIKILLADDHGLVRDGLRYLLEAQNDLKVIGEANNGREAVHLASQLLPDVVVLDIAMPKLNGIDAASQINANFPKLPIIILSMHSTIEHIYQALKVGVLGYVLKESAGSEVVSAIRTAYAGQHYLSHHISDELVKDYLLQRANLKKESPLEQLSGREREILQLVVEGKSSAAVGELLALSPKTIETYRSRMMQKLGIDDIPSLVKFAIQFGLTSL